MFNNVSFRKYFWIYRKGFKSFSPIKAFNRFFNILNICFTEIPYITDLFWQEGYTDVNFAINDIVMAFVKNASISTIFWGNVLVITKYKINTRHWVIHNVWYFNHLCICCWWCERIYFCTCWIRNVVFPLIFSTSIKISSNNWTERKFIIHLAKKNIKIWAKDFKLFLALMRWAVSTG